VDDTREATNKSVVEFQNRRKVMHRFRHILKNSILFLSISPLQPLSRNLYYLTTALNFKYLVKSEKKRLFQIFRNFNFSPTFPQLFIKFHRFYTNFTPILTEILILGLIYCKPNFHYFHQFHSNLSDFSVILTNFMKSPISPPK